jgi:hypothetical protein
MNNSTNGIGFSGLLTIVFITLKLTKVIDLSWVYILSPVLVTVMLTMILIIIQVVKEES